MLQELHRLTSGSFALLLVLNLACATALAQSKKNRPSKKTDFSQRAALLTEAKTAEPIALPVPVNAIVLPDDWAKSPDAVLSIRLASKRPEHIEVRRVAKGDGRLYLEVRDGNGALTGDAEVRFGSKTLGKVRINEALWLSLKPRIRKLAIEILGAGGSDPMKLSTPTTLVEVRGRQIYLNGEVFLMKGAMARDLNETDADYVQSLGINTLRGFEALADAEKYGFMNISSLNFGSEAPKDSMTAPDQEFEQRIAKSVVWLQQNGAKPVASPATLLLQLGNEKTGAGHLPPGGGAGTVAHRHVSQLLVAVRNAAKTMSPMLPVGYANQDVGFLVPDCMGPLHAQ